MKWTSIGALAGVVMSAIGCALPLTATAVEILTDEELEEVVAWGDEALDLPPHGLHLLSTVLPGTGFLASGPIASVIAPPTVGADAPVMLAAALFLPPQLFDYSLDIGPITDLGSADAISLEDGSIESSLYARIAYVRLLRLRAKGVPESRAIGDVEFRNIQFGVNDTVRVSYF